MINAQGRRARRYELEPMSLSYRGFGPQTLGLGPRASGSSSRDWRPADTRYGRFMRARQSLVTSLISPEARGPRPEAPTEAKQLGVSPDSRSRGEIEGPDVGALGQTLVA